MTNNPQVELEIVTTGRVFTTETDHESAVKAIKSFQHSQTQQIPIGTITLNPSDSAFDRTVCHIAWRHVTAVNARPKRQP